MSSLSLLQTALTKRTIHSCFLCGNNVYYFSFCHMSGVPFLAEADGRNSFMPQGRCARASADVEDPSLHGLTHEVFVVMLTDGLHQLTKT